MLHSPRSAWADKKNSTKMVCVKEERIDCEPEATYQNSSCNIPAALYGENKGRFVWKRETARPSSVEFPGSQSKIDVTQVEPYRGMHVPRIPLEEGASVADLIFHLLVSPPTEEFAMIVQLRDDSQSYVYRRVELGEHLELLYREAKRRYGSASSVWVKLKLDLIVTSSSSIVSEAYIAADEGDWQQLAETRCFNENPRSNLDQVLQMVADNNDERIDSVMDGCEFFLSVPDSDVQFVKYGNTGYRRGARNSEGLVWGDTPDVFSTKYTDRKLRMSLAGKEDTIIGWRLIHGTTIHGITTRTGRSAGSRSITLRTRTARFCRCY